LDDLFEYLSVWVPVTPRILSKLEGKVVKRLNGFKLLLKFHLENDLISDGAYNASMINIDSLFEKWEQ